MKTPPLKTFVIASAFLVFASLALSPCRAQSSSTSNTAAPAGGCCGTPATSTSNTSH